MDDGYAGSDRRRFQRLALNLVVWYKVLAPGYVRSYEGEKDYEAITLDISPMGMSFTSHHVIPLSSNLKLKFLVFNPQAGSFSYIAIPLETKGEVHSCAHIENDGYRIGVSFQDVATQQQKQLTDFLLESLRSRR